MQTFLTFLRHGFSIRKPRDSLAKAIFEVDFRGIAKHRLDPGNIRKRTGDVAGAFWFEDGLYGLAHDLIEGVD